MLLRYYYLLLQTFPSCSCSCFLTVVIPSRLMLYTVQIDRPFCSLIETFYSVAIIVVSLELNLQLGTTFSTETSEIPQTLRVRQACDKVIVGSFYIPYYPGLAGLLSSCTASLISGGWAVDSTKQEDDGCSLGDLEKTVSLTTMKVLQVSCSKISWLLNAQNLYDHSCHNWLLNINLYNSELLR